MVSFTVDNGEVVEVPDELVEAVKEERTTKSGRKRVYYALRAEYQGQVLTLSVDETTYRRFLGTSKTTPVDTSSHIVQTPQTEPPKVVRPPLPKGMQGKRILRFAGLLSEEEADRIATAIEEGCERVEAEQW